MTNNNLPYDYVVFDLAEVLIRGFGGLEQELSGLLQIRPQDVNSVLRAGPLNLFMYGLIDEEEFFRDLVNRTGCNLTSDELGQIFRRNFGILIPGTRELLPRLVEKYQLALASDHAQPWIDWIRVQHPFVDEFFCDPNGGRRQYFSYDFGCTKRSALFFQLLLRKLGCPAHRVLFVDDQPFNTSNAQAMGLHAIVFKDADQLESDFIRLGVLSPKEVMV